MSKQLHKSNQQHHLFMESSCTNITNSDEYETNVLESDNTRKFIRKHNINKITLVHMNINSMRNKFYSLIDQVNANADVLMVTETKPKRQIINKHQIILSHHRCFPGSFPKFSEQLPYRGKKVEVK